MFFFVTYLESLLFYSSSDAPGVDWSTRGRRRGKHKAEGKGKKGGHSHTKEVCRYMDMRITTWEQQHESSKGKLSWQQGTEQRGRGRLQNCKWEALGMIQVKRFQAVCSTILLPEGPFLVVWIHKKMSDEALHLTLIQFFLLTWLCSVPSPSFLS